MEAPFVSSWILYNFIEKLRGSDTKMAATVTSDEMTGHLCPVISNQSWSVRYVSLIKYVSLLNFGSYSTYQLCRNMIVINLTKFYV